MARRAIQGYPEKSYYENTKFSGIVATSDPLKEGSFALITNFDITDTGMSVTPRRGFLSTTFQLNDIPLVLTNKVLMFHDTALNKKVILDLEQLDTAYAYIVDVNTYNINDKNLLSEAHNIVNYDIKDFINYFMSNGLMYIDASIETDADVFKHIIRNTTLHQTVMLPIRDKDTITYYISHALYSFEHSGKTYETAFWFKILYREKETKRGDTVYDEDTLVISVIETETQSTNLDDRNIASSKSIIPDPLKTVEEQNYEGNLDTTVTHIPPTLLFATKTFENGWQYNNLLVDTIYRNHFDRFKIVPTFHLQDPTKILNTEHASWAYRFIITDMSKDEENAKRSLFKTPWHDVYTDNLLENTGAYTLTDDTTPHMFPNKKTFIIVPTGGWETYEIDSTDIPKKIYREGDPSYNIINMPVNVNDPRHLIEEIAVKTITETQIGSPQYGGAGISKFLKHDLASSIVSARTYEDLYSNPLFIQHVTNYPNFALIDLDDLKAEALRDKAYIEHSFEPDDDIFDVLHDPTNYIHTDSGVFELNKKELKGRSAVLTLSEYNALPKYYKREDLKNILTEAYKENAEVNIYTMSNVLRINNKKLEGAQWVDDGSIMILMNTNKIYADFILWQYVAHKDLDYLPDYRHPINREDFKMPTYKEIVQHKNSVVYNNPYNKMYLYNFYRDLLNTESYDFIFFNTHKMLDIFKHGINITMLLTPYDTQQYGEQTPFDDVEKESIGLAWEVLAERQTTLMTWAHKNDVVYLEEYSQHIENFKNITQFIIFEDRLVVWNASKVFVSNEGDYEHFSGKFVFEFDERVLKVLSFKNILLVFTTQHLYAIYRKEVETYTGEFTEEGQEVTENRVQWFTQPVLYNINPDQKYLDVIQVYNQMILFYSTEGQLYLIKPSPTIDSETQFGIQYFNKSANDILLNYDRYINERLLLYNKIDINDITTHVTKDDITIKALLSIDRIKIFYTVSDVITFVLVYDVVNNRYTTYDTLTFTQIKHVEHIEGGEMYLTEHQDNTYFTMPRDVLYTPDSNIDQHYAYMFKKEPIFATLDTGNMDLNNHLRKRFRDLRIHLKNINSNKIMYNASMLLDGNIVRPFYAPEFRVKMLNGPDYNINLEKVSDVDMTELFGPDLTIGATGMLNNLHSYYLYNDKEFFNDNTLLRTEMLNASGLIEYNSSIIGVGKTARLKLLFISKGKYKLQSFGIVYKERSI